MAPSEKWGARGATGRRAEALAADWLERHGFRIIERNWRHPEGELDLVAEHQGACVFVEVRSRTGADWGDPLESITQRKRARVIRSARLYLDSERAFSAPAYRFDVVGVTFSADDSDQPLIQHIPAAFDLND